MPFFPKVNAKNQCHKDYNERMTEKAEALRCRRYESIVNERYKIKENPKVSLPVNSYSFSMYV